MKESKRIQDQYLQQSQSLTDDVDEVSDHLTARYGAIITDRTDIIGRLIKNRSARLEDLNSRFHMDMPEGRAAFPWKRRNRWMSRMSRRNHERCMYTYSNWDSSDDDGADADRSSIQRHNPFGEVTHDDDSEASESGDYFREYQQTQRRRTLPPQESPTESLDDEVVPRRLDIRNGRLHGIHNLLLNEETDSLSSADIQRFVEQLSGRNHRSEVAREQRDPQPRPSVDNTDNLINETPTPDNSVAAYGITPEEILNNGIRGAAQRYP